MKKGGRGQIRLYHNTLHSDARGEIVVFQHMSAGKKKKKKIEIKEEKIYDKFGVEFHMIDPALFELFVFQM